MVGDGPFLWLREGAPDAGFQRLPRGGMCLSVFLFVTRGDELLLGKYANVPEWERLTGLDEARRRAYGRGWTIPASHLKFGEDPREAARRVAREVLRLPDLRVSEARVATEHYELPADPGATHYDVLFLVDAEAPPGLVVERPPWYAALEWHDWRALPASAFGRAHEDVLAHWRGRG